MMYFYFSFDCVQFNCFKSFILKGNFYYEFYDYEAEDAGFEILDFPCNQFGNQAPGTTEEIASFCDAKFGITFKLFPKLR